MLFNSFEFIFVFLPLAFIGMFFLGRHSHRLAALWLGLSSLTFYGVWDARFVLLLLSSIAFNYGAGYWIGLQRSGGKGNQARYAFVFAVAANLSLLGYFKYADFFLNTANSLLDAHFANLNIILPLGISFFTFTQIAFLADVYRGIAREYNFLHYLLFVTYFPHLIAGPILHHKQMMPQFARPETFRINWDNVAIGMSIFILGLSKKVLIADHVAVYATPVFDAVRHGGHPMFFEAWMGSLAYTLQLYFDFSGYSDMAIGLSLMFNVRLPLNFDSPYKSTSIIEFWRRWHMTLSAFLRDYLYIPLGGNRKGVPRRYANLMITMLLGGLWHGAGWTYVAWGGLHGFFLMVNHAWRAVKASLGWTHEGRIARLAGGALTFLCVVVGWVFFRADSFTSALSMLSGMAGLGGISLPVWLAGPLAGLNDSPGTFGLVFQGFAPLTKVSAPYAVIFIVFGLAMAWLMPNVRDMFRAYRACYEDMQADACAVSDGERQWLVWRPTRAWALLLGMLFTYTLISIISIGKSVFLYFQF